MDKQRRKGYGFNKAHYNKRPKQYCLDVGMTGFLCTCNFREKECIRDAYKILEEFANELYGNDEKNDKNSQSKMAEEKNGDEEKVKGDIEKEDGADKEEDISDALNKEIAELHAEAKKPAAAKRFQNADVGIKNVIFISTTLPDPLELVLKIVKKLDETKQQKTRFLLRLVPIQVVCRANIPDIKIKADQLFEKYFAQEPKTFSIVFNRHCNDKISRKDMIDELADLISKKNPGNRADLTNPEIAVVVEIVKGLCLLAIAPDYFKYKKYNLLELCNIKELEKSPKKAEVSPETNGEKKSEIADETDKKIADSEVPAEPEVETAHVDEVPAEPEVEPTDVDHA